MENAEEIKRDLLGKIEMNPVVLISQTKYFNEPIHFRNQEILDAHLINEDQMLVISCMDQYLYLNKTDQKGNLLVNKHIFTFCNGNLNVKYVMNNEKLILLTRHTHSEGYGYNSRNQLLIFDKDLIQIKQKTISDANNIISLAVKDSKYYCLLRSTSNINFLSIYDNDLNEIGTKGLDAKSKEDPFYFPDDSIQLRVTNQSFYILGNGLMRVINKETGIITKEFHVVGPSFVFYKYGFALFNGANTIIIYNKVGRKRKEIVFPDEFDKCNSKFLTSESNLIGFNQSNNRIIISNFR
jgi:hypothetical protein